MPPLLIAAVVVPILTFGSVAAARGCARWFRHTMRDGFADAVNDIVGPPIDRHLADHEVLSERLAVVEALAVELERRVVFVEVALAKGTENDL